MTNSTKSSDVFPAPTPKPSPDATQDNPTSNPSPQVKSKHDSSKLPSATLNGAPSPFLPGTNLQHTWDATSLSWLKSCPRKYEYSMIRGLRRSGSTSAHLIFGQHYHSALELYDKQRAEGIDHEAAVRAVCLHALRVTWNRVDCPTCNGTGGMGFEPCTDCLSTGTDHQASGPWISDHNLKTRESLLRSVIWYLEQFGESDPAATLILKDGKPAVELTFKFDSDIPINTSPYLDQPEWPATYFLSGHLDRVVSFLGDPYVLDRKTSSTALTPLFFSQFNPHTQMTLYTIAGQVIFDTSIKGVIIDGAQVAAGFTRFARGFTPRTPGHLDEYLSDLRYWFSLAESYAAEGYWPQNTESCHHYGGCPFRRICSLDPGARESFLRTDYEINPWNPLSVR